MRITKNTFSIHHFNGGWLDEKMRRMNEKTVNEFDAICKNMIFDNNESEKYYV